ncbi:uncharacterized protein LOC123872211 [Maniola jurtina]|uniref:uncharacterized protein LOC123872211 n=1 Tax=Maniola jurtina TaxID=191418 RepID=UPI001E688DF8|nr:uncharacterized protein LOC123872211 [Maniola jurtina]
MKTILIVVFASYIKLSETSELIKKAVSVANSAFNKYHLTSIVWERCDGKEITDFLELYEGTVVTIAMNKDVGFNYTDFHTNVLYKQTVFFAVEPDEFEYFLKMINHVIVVPIKVILVIANRELSTISTISTEFTKTAWDNDVGDIVIVGYDADDTVSLKTYFPYENGICNNYIPVSLRPNTTKYFMEKFRNFNGCPIRVTLLENIPYVKLKKENDTVTAVGGIDGNLLKLIIEKVNSTMEIVSSVDYGVVSTCLNGTRVGSFNNLVYNKADIMAPSIIIVSMRYVRSQISYVYYTVKVVWCIPKRREIYEWVKAIMPFLNMSTPIIILAILIINVIMRVVKKIGKLKEKSNKGNLFQMIGIFLGQQVHINSKYRIINSLLIFWIWFCLVVRISYQGKLIDGLRKTILEPPIETLAEAMKVFDELGGMPTFIELYRNTSIENKYNSIKLSEIPHYLKEMAAGRKFLLAVDTTQLLYYRRDLHILEERVTSVPACIHMRARWPAAPEVNRLVGRSVESGLVLKIWMDIRNEWLLHRKVNDTNTFEPLGLKTLSSCFYGLFIMYCISFFVFSLEIILNRYKRPKKCKRVIKIKKRNKIFFWQ